MVGIWKRIIKGFYKNENYPNIEIENYENMEVPLYKGERWFVNIYDRYGRVDENIGFKTLKAAKRAVEGWFR